MSESIGSKLKQVRLEKGFSLEDIHKKTKLHLDIIKAIEDDSLINVNPTYVRGFLKIYCKALGVDAKDYISDYKEARQDSMLSPQSKSGKVTPALKLTSQRLSFLKKINYKKILAILVVVVVLFFITKGIFAFGRFISSSISNFVAKYKAANAAAAAVVDKKPVDKVKKNAPEAVTKKQKDKTPVVSVVRLGVSTREDCWVKVKLDGKVVFQRVLKKGRFESWEAKDKIELSLGNAGVVTLEVNGQAMSSLGRKGQAVKNIVITKEGLNIPR